MLTTLFSHSCHQMSGAMQWLVRQTAEVENNMWVGVGRVLGLASKRSRCCVRPVRGLQCALARELQGR